VDRSLPALIHPRQTGGTRRPAGPLSLQLAGVWLLGDEGSATGHRGAAAPRWPSRDEPVGLAPGVRLLGPYASSGLHGEHFLAERGDGQVVHLSRLLHLVVSEVDGRRSGTEVADRVSARFGRQLTPDGVEYLVEHKLGPAGLIAPVGAVAPPPTAQPLLALRLRRTLLPARPTGWVADLLAPLYHPPVVAVLLGSFVAVEIAVFRSGRVLPALGQVLVMTGALVAVLGLLLLSGLFHECGHAAACAYSGARPGKIGVGLYLVVPAFYTDVTAAYQLNRTGRLRTDLGGLYFNTIVVLGLAVSYLVVPTPALLVAILLVNLEMLQQLLPIVRLDGYFILSDLIGIPDLFGRIGPVLSSLLPGRPTHPRAAQLRPHARAVLTGWVLVVVPLLVGGLVVATVRLPVLVQTSWHAVEANWASLQASRHAGNAAGVLLAGVAVVLLVLPMVGLMLLYENLARTGVRSARGLIRRHHQGRSAVQPDDAPLAAPVPVDPDVPLTAAAFTEAELVGARGGDPPAGGWRRAAWKVSGGRWDPGPSEAQRREAELLDRIRVPVRGCRRIVVLSRKGGAGKTTTALMLGHTFATYRGDRVVALDANPDAGSLAYRVRRESAATATTLLSDDSMTARYCDIRAYTSQSMESRLEVLASDDDPRISRALGEQAYRRILGLLDRHYQLVVVDTGTGILDSSVQGLISEADQIVLVMPPALDGVRVAAATLDWLDEHGCSALVRRGVAVINAVRDERVIRLDRVEDHFGRRCAGVVRVPWDPTLQAGGHTKLGELRPATRQAYLRLAALAADDFGRPGPRPRTLPAVGAAARINGHRPIDPTPASTRPSQDGADV
jgi:putative peptide zinc metalloprotease protein